MLITALVVSFCKDGGGSVNVKLWFLVVCVRCEVLCRLVVAGNVFPLVVFIIVNINTNTLPATTKRQRTSHRTYTAKNHNFTLTLRPPSLQNETTNVVINIIVASS